MVAFRHYLVEMYTCRMADIRLSQCTPPTETDLGSLTTRLNLNEEDFIPTSTHHHQCYLQDIARRRGNQVYKKRLGMVYHMTNLGMIQ
mmetsp:Transcript_59492/g.81287  ORF Transcript_59492/g.81287 Transcript_59492/m.81287 type:complete len:88 (+) Transcript_59492:113-376(+)